MEKFTNSLLKASLIVSSIFPKTYKLSECIIISTKRKIYLFAQKQNETKNQASAKLSAFEPML